MEIHFFDVLKNTPLPMCNRRLTIKDKIIFMKFIMLSNAEIHALREFGALDPHGSH